MEYQNQVFHIQIEEYEKDLNREASRGKKEEIIELLKNHNQISSLQELNEIKDFLHDACQIGDLELIEIYLSETIENESKDLTFKINKTKKTASLFKINDRQIQQIIVPRTVNHESTEYLITSICWIGEKMPPRSSIKKNYI